MPHRAIAERAYHASCELNYLASLLAGMVGQLDRIGTLFDPRKEAALVADEARIACDYALGIARRLVDPVPGHNAGRESVDPATSANGSP